MNNSDFSDTLKRYRAEAADAGKLRALTDLDLEKVAGGVGGENEATCPKCGQPMTLVGADYGDGVWECEKCKVNQLFSDAETIELINAMEQINYPGIEYPVWWDQVKKKK